MSAHHLLLRACSVGLVATFVLVGVFAARATFGDAAPIDRGPPPALFSQGEFTSVASAAIVAAPVGVEASPLGLDPVELLVLAAVGVIFLGLVTMLVTSGERHGLAAAEGEPSSQQFLEASRAIHAARSIEKLCMASVDRALVLTESAGAMITIDGVEAASGAEFVVPTELVFQANRLERQVAHGDLQAIPIWQRGEIEHRGDVVGLLVIKSGRESTLSAFASLVEDGFDSVASRAHTAALVFVDGLTGIANRRRFDSDLDRVVGSACQEGIPLAVAMFDVDDFKSFNDSNGHQAGDDVLRSVAELISANLRSADVVYRYGGEEFVALLPGATVEDAFVVVDRIRRIVASTPFLGELSQPSGAVTLSVGVAGASTGTGRALVHAADMALYEAKTNGRNRVVLDTAS